MLSVKRFVLVLIVFVLLGSCKNEKVKTVRSEYQSFTGATMGTSYHITYKGNKDSALQTSIDSILVKVNASVSTYIPSSTISQINNDSLGQRKAVLMNGKSHSLLKYQFKNDVHFLKNLEEAQEVFRKTDGFFDPTVMPLVNYWGFGYTPKRAVTSVDSNKVNSIMASLGLEHWKLSNDLDSFYIIKPPQSELDFSGIAKGYAVDLIADYFDNLNLENYLIEIGGELKTKGLNRNNDKWAIALNKPEIKANINEFQSTLKLQNVSLASSGNYRNYHVVEGKYYGHEINPSTGFPEINDLLGVSVVSEDCIIADAYATAFMVMGLKKSVNLVEQLNGIEACFFYSNDEGHIEERLSSDFAQYLGEQTKH